METQGPKSVALSHMLNRWQLKPNCKGRFELGVEQLELRLALDISAGFIDTPGGFGFLLSGSPADDWIEVGTPAGAGGTQFSIVSSDPHCPPLGGIITDQDIAQAAEERGLSPFDFEGFIVRGGDGNDLLIADGSGQISQPPNERLQADGGSGDDELRGSPGNDVLQGGPGNDVLHGGAGIDTLVGGDGNDFLNGGDGPDPMSAGAGQDLLSLEYVNGTLLDLIEPGVFGGPGTDTFRVKGTSTASEEADVLDELIEGENTGITDFGVTQDILEFETPAQNQPPTISDIANRTINVNTSTGPISFLIDDDETPLAQLGVTAVSSNTLLVPNGNLMLGGGGANRTITATPASNQSGQTTITVTVTDEQGAQASDSFVLTVISPNSPPTISNIANRTINVNQSTGAIPFVVGDAETPVVLLRVTAVSSNSLLVPNGNLALGGGGANRNITATPASNQSGQTTITVTVTDGQGAQSSDSFVLSVISPNSPPTISDIANQTINVNQSTGSISFVVGDAETPVTQLGVTAVSSNTSLVPNGNLSLGGSGANRTITATPASNQTGQTTITVTVTDGQGAQSIDSFVLSVITPPIMNTRPTIADIPDQTVDKNESTGEIPFVIDDAESSAEFLNVSAEAFNMTLVPTENIIFGGSGANRTISIRPGVNQIGQSTIVVTVRDSSGAESTDFIVLTVNPGNNAAPSVELESIESPRAGSVDSLIIQFSAPVTGFNKSNLQLTRRTDSEEVVSLGNATLSPINNRTWRLSNLGPLTLSAGIYNLDLTPTGITDESGNALAEGAQQSWTNGPGDVNFDGIFDQFDLLDVHDAGKYKTLQPATWREGDWNGDGVFDERDLMFVLTLGHYRTVRFAPPPLEGNDVGQGAE